MSCLLSLRPSPLEPHASIARMPESPAFWHSSTQAFWHNGIPALPERRNDAPWNHGWAGILHGLCGQSRST